MPGVKELLTCCTKRRFTYSMRQLAVLLIGFGTVAFFGYEHQRRLEIQIENMFHRVISLREEQNKLLDLHERFSNDVNKSVNSMRAQYEQIELLEQYSLRYNLRFLGIPESENDNPEELVKIIIEKTMEITLFDSIADAVRVDVAVKPRPILVKFSRWKDKNKVLYRRKSLPPGIIVEEDLTKSQRKTRDELKKIAKEAEVEGRKVKWSGKQLFIDGVEVKV